MQEIPVPMTRTLLTSMLVAAFVIQPVFAQEVAPDVLSYGRALRALDLTEEQQAQLRELIAEYRAAVQQSTASVDAAIMELLTEPQRKRLNQMRERTEAVRERVKTNNRRRGRTRGAVRGRTRGAARGKAPEHSRRARQPRRGQSAMPRLSHEQRVALEAVREEAAQARRNFAEENPEASSEEKRAFGAQQRARLAEATASILTAEQQLMMMRHLVIPRRSTGLELSSEQAAQVKEAVAAYRNANAEWAKAHPEASRQDRATHARSAWESLQTALAEILTPEQMEKLRRPSPDRRHGVRR